MLATRSTYRLLTVAAVLLALGSGGLAAAQPTSPPATTPPSGGGGLTQPVATVITGALALGAALIAFLGVYLTRRQTEKHFAVSHRAEQVRGLRERYTTCAQQLGDDHATVRAAGVYALVALAEDWIALGSADTRPGWLRRWLRSLRLMCSSKTDRQKHQSNTDAARSNDAQTCIDLLCSYLRSPWINEPFSVVDERERDVRMAGLRALTRFRKDGASSDNRADYKLDFSEANFRWLTLGSTVDLARANLHRADLEQANLHGADLRNARLNHAKLTGADLSQAKLAGAQLMFAELASADLKRADLTAAKLRNSTLRSAALTAANLSQTDLKEANLSRADLTRADLTDADLTGADLSEAVLTGARLIRANLTRADLSEADLTGADLTGADLPGAILSGAKLIGAKLNGHDIEALKQAGALVPTKDEDR